MDQSKQTNNCNSRRVDYLVFATVTLFITCIFALFVLFGGSPDLMDAIIHFLKAN